ncbi:SM-like, degradation of cytoplasmic mRNAs and positively regulates transcription initiation [Coelomomyces lativittatus]|nr:SM-like, degradation of cytoplasmic mRNAs and positively regulates transcription initiation [Coelomomyces lativittatus]
MKKKVPSVNQLLPGAASLLDCLDKRILVILRDGRSLTGILRSYDQFGNLVFQDTIERIHVGEAYSDIERGIFLVRGENVVLLGEMDGELEDQLGLNSVPIEAILLLQKQEAEKRQVYQKIQKKVLSGVGFSVDFDKHDVY